MRIFASFSRTLSAVSIAVAALLVLAAAYVVGYVGEVRHQLDADPRLGQIAASVRALETALGYDGFLRAYRNYRVTGDGGARGQLVQRAAEGMRALKGLEATLLEAEWAKGALRETRAVAEMFTQVAKTAPDIGSVALRGTTAMEGLNALPQTHQLEVSYLVLRSALARLIAPGAAQSLRGAAALHWSQWLLLAALTSLILGLVAIAAVLHFGFRSKTKTLERGALSAIESAASGIKETSRAVHQKAAHARAEDRRLLVATVSQLHEIARRLNDASQSSAPAALQGFTDTLHREVEALRGEIGEMAVRMGEDRILATGGGLAIDAGAPCDAPARAARTLADVPTHEIMSRLSDLATEMKTVQLGSEGPTTNIAALRESAGELGMRAQSAFVDLDKHADGHDPSATFEAAASDVARLAESIAEIEARVERLCESALAARLVDVDETLSPSELAPRHHCGDLKVDATIRALFGSVERLHNIAAALARAGDIEHRRRKAH